MIESLKSERGGWTLKNLAALGVPWPPQPGWKRRIIGKPLQPIVPITKKERIANAKAGQKDAKNNGFYNKRSEFV